MPICPTCHSKGVKKNGYTRHQKQNHLCLACHHQFVEERTDKRISEETRTLIQKALKERVSLEGICRIFTVSMSWLLKFINTIFDKLPEDLLATVSQSDDVEVALMEIDEQWSYVGNKRNPQWLWSALDTSSRQVLAIHIGPRTRSSAEALLSKLPEEVKKKPTFVQISFQCTTKYLPQAKTSRQSPGRRSYKSPGETSPHPQAKMLATCQKNSFLFQKAQKPYWNDQILYL